MRFASAPRPLVRDGRSARSSDPTAVPTSASPEVVLRNTREILDRIGRRRVDAECLCPSGGSPHSPLGRSAQDEERSGARDLLRRARIFTLSALSSKPKNFPRWEQDRSPRHAIPSLGGTTRPDAVAGFGTQWGTIWRRGTPSGVIGEAD